MIAGMALEEKWACCRVGREIPLLSSWAVGCVVQLLVVAVVRVVAPVPDAVVVDAADVPGVAFVGVVVSFAYGRCWPDR